MRTYSDFFKTLHDETKPTGHLGRGTHYSVLRAIVFHDPCGNVMPQGQFADFAVIWDDDHDVRVMEPIEEIYRQGLLSSFLMFGERKGTFTAILSNKTSPTIEATPNSHVFFDKVDELLISVRSANCLKNDNIVYIGDLVQKTEAEMLRSTNFGDKSLNEVKEVLGRMGLHLGMEVPDWPPKNIHEIAKLHARPKCLTAEIGSICQSLNDPWASTVVALEGVDNPIIHDANEKVSLYLKNLEMLWQLGIVGGLRRKADTLASDLVRRHVHAEPRADAPEAA